MCNPLLESVTAISDSMLLRIIVCEIDAVIIFQGSLLVLIICLLISRQLFSSGLSYSGAHPDSNF